MTHYNPNAGNFTATATLKASKKEAKALRRLIQPKVRPDNLKYPRKHRKWRVAKKWFNRYEKHLIIGMRLIVGDKTGAKYNAVVTGVRMAKGGHTRNFDFTAKPI